MQPPRIVGFLPNCSSGASAGNLLLGNPFNLSGGGARCRRVSLERMTGALDASAALHKQRSGVARR